MTKEYSSKLPCSSRHQVQVIKVAYLVILYLVITKNAGIELQCPIDIASANDGTRSTSSVFSVIIKPGASLDHFKEIIKRVFHKEVLFPGRVARYIADDLSSVFLQFLIAISDIHRLHFGGEDPQVADLYFKRWSQWDPAFILPNLKTTASLQINSQGSVPLAGFSAGVRQHQFSHRIILKNTDIHAEIVFVPDPCLFQVLDSNSDLLNTGNIFLSHANKLIRAKISTRFKPEIPMGNLKAHPHLLF